MTSIIYKGHLDFLSENQKTELSKHFMTASATAMPHQLAVRLGIQYSEALALLADLEAEGMCDMKLLIYHNCDPDVPVDAIPYGTGFPDLPWTCPHCESILDSYDELSFDMMAIPKQAIVFV
jgi:rubredoxin